MIYDPHIIASPGKKILLGEYDTNYTGVFTSKGQAKHKLKEDIKKLKILQDKLFAHNKFALLMIFQAMDAAGKDGTIKHVMSGINPQGCQVYSFKKPSDEELDHDYLWRTYKCLPERGMIGIFNRSYYEEVLVVRVHPEILFREQLPGITRLSKINPFFWEKRYKQINNMECHLVENGTIILKFFLHISKEEQKKRFLERINNPDKNWKFTLNDIEERKYWDKYQKAFEEVIYQTSTEFAPWYIIPADKKWYMRTVVGDIIVHALESLPLKYPVVSTAKRKDLQKAKELLLNETN